MLFIIGPVSGFFDFYLFLTNWLVAFLGFYTFGFWLFGFTGIGFSPYIPGFWLFHTFYPGFWLFRIFITWLFRISKKPVTGPYHDR